MAKIIGADSSTRASGVAFFDSEKNKLAVKVDLGEEMRAEELLHIFDRLLKEENIRQSLPDAYAVALGPGSFTGLRIGVTMLKTMAQFSKRPIIGISSLEALAYSCLYDELKIGHLSFDSDGKDEGLKSSGPEKSLPMPKPEDGDLIIPLVDARANRVFASAYLVKNKSLERILDENMYYEEDLISYIEELTASSEPVLGSQEESDKVEKDIDKRRIFWAGLGIEAHMGLISALEKEWRENIIPVGNPMASPVGALCRLAAKRYEKGDFDSYLDLKPNYLRKSQAELERERKLIKEAQAHQDRGGDHA